VRVTALVGNSSFLDQDGLEHGSPLSSGTILSNNGSGDLNGWGDVCIGSLHSLWIYVMLVFGEVVEAVV